MPWTAPTRKKGILFPHNLQLNDHQNEKKLSFHLMIGHRNRMIISQRKYGFSKPLLKIAAISNFMVLLDSNHNIHGIYCNMKKRCFSLILSSNQAIIILWILSSASTSVISADNKLITGTRIGDMVRIPQRHRAILCSRRYKNYAKSVKLERVWIISRVEKIA